MSTTSKRRRMPLSLRIFLVMGVVGLTMILLLVLPFSSLDTSLGVPCAPPAAVMTKYENAALASQQAIPATLPGLSDHQQQIEQACPLGLGSRCQPARCSTVPVTTTTAAAAICMIVKNEEAYLDEFVDYHIALGFTTIFIYDNSHDFVLRQWALQRPGCQVELVHYPGHSPQKQAYHHCAKHALQVTQSPSSLQHYTWLAFFDADEILILKQHDNIVDFLQQHCTSGALGIPWLVFGSANQVLYSPQPFTKRFVYRKRKPEPLVKSFARLQDIELDGHNDTLKVHYPFLKPGFAQHDTRGANFTGASHLAAPTDVAVLHHYKYKSLGEYWQKASRGQAASHYTATGDNWERATRNQIPAARLYDDTAWEKMKYYVPKYALYDVLYPPFPPSSA